MAISFETANQVEDFLSEKGYEFHRVTLHESRNPFWKVKVGKSFCEVYDIVGWANMVLTRIPQKKRKPRMG